MLIIVLVSFLGFCIENIFIVLNHGCIDNRNMTLPFLLGYGLAILAYYRLFGTPDSPLFFGKKIHFSSSFKSTFFCFAVAFIGVSMGEIILGYATEWCCGIVWWNYTRIPLHITKYTSVPTSFGFATMITVFMKYCFNPLLNFFSKIHPSALSFFATAMLSILILDAINSGIYMFKHNEILHLWDLTLKAYK